MNERRRIWPFFTLIGDCTVTGRRQRIKLNVNNSCTYLRFSQNGSPFGLIDCMILYVRKEMRERVRARKRNRIKYRNISAQVRRSLYIVCYARHIHARLTITSQFRMSSADKNRCARARARSMWYVNILRCRNEVTASIRFILHCNFLLYGVLNSTLCFYRAISFSPL